MTTQTSQQFISQAEAKENPFSKWWGSMVTPAESIVGDNRRKAKSLASLALIFLLLGIVTVFATPVKDLVNGVTIISTPPIGGIVGIALILFTYALSRTKYHHLGAYLLISAPAVAVTVTVTGTGASDTALFYMTLSVILSSLLLSSRETLIIGILIGALVIFLPVIAPIDNSTNPTSIMTYVAIATGVMSLISRIREQNLAQLESTQEELVQRIEEVDEARQRAERSDQVKSTFLASMSHELRTPLNAIINFTRFVVKGTLGPVNEEQTETLDNVIVSGKHLLNLINDVLDMAKIESDSLNLFVSDEVPIQNIVEEMSAIGRALLNEKSVELTTEIDGTLPLIRGDQQRIRQILLNLVSNACKFTSEGSITLSAKQDNNNILIAIADTGAGIAKEDQTLVFEAFKQTDAGLRQGGGTGLGMPITKNLIEAHGGHIRLESEVGQGTTFYISLPVKSTTLTPTLITEV